ncbi:MAG: hypothetical protein ACW98I_15115 [Candidatus Hodarchaeales archaeon]|jgi:hypothetical protein
MEKEILKTFLGGEVRILIPPFKNKTIKKKKNGRVSSDLMVGLIRISNLFESP